MKVLGVKETSSYVERVYIAEISNEEIKKIFNKSWSDKGSSEFRELKAGEIIDLGSGYVFREEIRSVCKEMMESHKQFLKSSKTLFELAKLLVIENSDDNAKL